MGEEQLREIAAGLKIKGAKKMTKDELVYDILDAEAVIDSQKEPEKQKRRGRPRKQQPVQQETSGQQVKPDTPAETPAGNASAADSNEKPKSRRGRKPKSAQQNAEAQTMPQTAQDDTPAADMPVTSEDTANAEDKPATQEKDSRTRTRRARIQKVRQETAQTEQDAQPAMTSAPEETESVRNEDASAEAQQPALRSTPASREVMLNSALWLRSTNSAGLALDSLRRTGDIGLSASYSRGGLKSVWSGENETDVKVSTSGIAKVGGITLYGDFSYAYIAVNSSKYNCVLYEPSWDQPYYVAARPPTTATPSEEEPHAAVLAQLPAAAGGSQEDSEQRGHL